MPPKPQLLVLLASTVLALITWCRLSELQPGTGLNYRYAWLLLAASGVLRLAARPVRGQAIESLSTSIDAYALGTLAGLRASRSRRMASPLWPALMLLASLPAERVLQRTAGLALRSPEAFAAGTVLLLAAAVTLALAVRRHRLLQVPE